MPGVRWDDVRVFLALFRERSLAAAAKRLRLDTSTVSRRLGGLEDALACRLFDRTPDGLVATAAAEQLLVAAEETEAGIFNFANAADGFESEVEGLVRIATMPGVAENFAAPFLHELIERHPRLRVELVVSVHLADLTRREADLALRSIRPATGDFLTQRVARSRWLLMASPERAHVIGTLNRWPDVPWIAWGNDLAHIPAARWFSEHVGVEPVLRTSHAGAQLAALESGLGVALCADAYAAVRRIVPVTIGPALAADAAAWPSDELWLVGHRSLRHVPRVAAVWTFLTERFATALTRPPRASRQQPET